LPPHPYFVAAIKYPNWEPFFECGVDQSTGKHFG
jgi:hypothetical protein